MHARPLICRFGRLALVLATAALATPSAQAGDALLRWKFEPGLELQYAFPHSTTTEARVGGRDLKTETVSRGEVRLTVIKLDGPDRADVRLSLERMRIDIKAPTLGVFHYDSAGRQRTKGYMDNVIAGYDALARRSFHAILDRRGELLAVSIPEQERQALAAEKLALDSILTPRGLSQLLGLSWPQLPEQALTVGDHWELNEKFVNPALGDVQAKRAFTYDGPTERNGKTLDKISVALVLAADTKTQQGNLTFKLKAQQSEGALYFDRAAGRFVEGQSRLQLTLDTNTGDEQFDQTLITTSGFVLLDSKTPADE